MHPTLRVFYFLQFFFHGEHTIYYLLSPPTVCGFFSDNNCTFQKNRTALSSKGPITQFQRYGYHLTSRFCYTSLPRLLWPTVTLANHPSSFRTLIVFNTWQYIPSDDCRGSQSFRWRSHRTYFWFFYGIRSHWVYPNKKSQHSAQPKQNSPPLLQQPKLSLTFNLSLMLFRSHLLVLH